MITNASTPKKEVSRSAYGKAHILKVILLLNSIFNDKNLQNFASYIEGQKLFRNFFGH